MCNPPSLSSLRSALAIAGLTLAGLTPTGCAVGPERAREFADASRTRVPHGTRRDFEDIPPPSPPKGSRASDQARQEYRDAVDAWLTPPPPDQPQPKFVCARPEYEAEPVWFGQLTTFSWDITNEGEAPLRIHMVT